MKVKINLIVLYRSIDHDCIIGDAFSCKILISMRQNRLRLEILLLLSLIACICHGANRLKPSLVVE